MLMCIYINKPIYALVIIILDKILEATDRVLLSPNDKDYQTMDAK